MTTSDYIQLGILIFTALSVFVALIVSTCTLRQNSKMIEESTRPYISIYFDSIYVSSTRPYLIIKNFGKTSGCISKFTCSHDLSEHSFDLDRPVFKNIVGAVLNPNQTFIYPMMPKSDFYKIEILTFNVEYYTASKKYCETINLNLSTHTNIVHLRANSKGCELEHISYILQNITEKML